MSNDLIVKVSLCSDTPDYIKYPAEHSRSAGRAGFLEIDCLLNDPAPVVYKLAPSGSECEPQTCVSSKEQKRCCTENTAPSDVSSPCNCNRGFSRCNRGFSRSRYPGGSRSRAPPAKILAPIGPGRPIAGGPPSDPRR